jgi:hypothetical protein
VVAGAACAAAGTALLGTVGVATAAWRIWLALFVFGAGLGQLLGQLIIVSQQAVPVRQLGITTTAVRFGQTLGGAFGAALFGTVLNRVYTATNSLVTAIDVVFVSAAGVAVLVLLLALRLRVDQDRSDAGPGEPGAVAVSPGSAGRPSPSLRSG